MGRNFATLKEGDWILIVSPPCNTSPRARFQYLKSPGPRPLRNFQWPRGFPWLAFDKRRIVVTATHFIDQCVVACTSCFHHNEYYLWEHPEDLGDVTGEHPGSIWQWPSIRGLPLLRYNNAILAQKHPNRRGLSPPSRLTIRDAGLSGPFSVSIISILALFLRNAVTFIKRS